MSRQVRDTTLGARLQASWREASRVGLLALDVAYRVHASLTVEPLPISDGWQVVDSDSLSDSDDVPERDVASDNDGLFDTEPVVGGYGLPDLDSTSDQDPGTSCDGSDDEQSFYEAGSDSASGTYHDARSTFDDGSEDEQLPSHASSQPAAARSGLCSSLEQSQTLKVGSVKGKGRAERCLPPSARGGFPLAQPITAPSLHESPSAGLSRRSSPPSDGGFGFGLSSLAAPSSSPPPLSVSGPPGAGSSSGAFPILGGNLGAWGMTPVRPRSPPFPPWPPVPPPASRPEGSLCAGSMIPARPRSPPFPPWPPVPPPTTANFDRFDPKVKAKIAEVRRQHRAGRYRTDAGPSSASPDSTMAADEGATEPNTAGSETRTQPTPPLSRLLEELPPLEQARQRAARRDPPRRAQPETATRGRRSTSDLSASRRPGPRSSPRLPTRRALPAPPATRRDAEEVEAELDSSAQFLGANSPAPTRPRHHHREHHHQQQQQQYHQQHPLHRRHTDRPDHPSTRARPRQPAPPTAVCMNPGGESPYRESMQGELREAVGGGGDGSGSGGRVETLADGRTRVRAESFVGADGWRYWMWEYV